MERDPELSTGGRHDDDEGMYVYDVPLHITSDVRVHRYSIEKNVDDGGAPTRGAGGGGGNVDIVGHVCWRKE